MGAHNNFAPKGRSSYELANLTCTFSYMTVEQLCNWTLTAGCYMAKTRRQGLAEEEQEGHRGLPHHRMVNRGGDVGFAQFDSHQDGGRPGNHDL